MSDTHTDDKSEQMATVLQLMQQQIAQQGQLIEMLVQSRTNNPAEAEAEVPVQSRTSSTPGGEAASSQPSEESNQAAQTTPTGTASGHPTAASDDAGAARVQKAVRPVAHLNMPETKWQFFMHEWKRYKRSTGISGQAVVDQLIDACSEELREDIFRSMGEGMSTADEKKLCEEIQRLAVRSHSKIVNRHGMMMMNQADDEPVTQYVARLRGQAALCDFSVTCPCCATSVYYGEEAINDQLIRGLSCKDTQEEVLARGSDLTTQQKIVDFVAAKERAVVVVVVVLSLQARGREL